MDNGRALLPILVLLIAVGGMFAYRYLVEVDEANGRLLNARESFATAQGAVKTRKDTWQSVEAAAAKLRDAKARLDKSARELEEVAKKERLMESNLRYLANSMTEAVERVRAAGVGTLHSEIILVDAGKLKDAQIKRIDESGISFLHSEGFQVVPLKNLPPALIEQFDLGPNSLVKQIGRLSVR